MCTLCSSELPRTSQNFSLLLLTSHMSLSVFWDQVISVSVNFSLLDLTVTLLLRRPDWVWDLNLGRIDIVMRWCASTIKCLILPKFFWVGLVQTQLVQILFPFWELGRWEIVWRLVFMRLDELLLLAGLLQVEVDGVSVVGLEGAGVGAWLGGAGERGHGLLLPLPLSILCSLNLDIEHPQLQHWHHVIACGSVSQVSQLPKLFNCKMSTLSLDSIATFDILTTCGTGQLDFLNLDIRYCLLEP